MVIGGGGAMHGADLARELQVKELIIPQNAGVFSAFGMLMSDIRRDYIRTNVITLIPEQLQVIQDVFTEIEMEAIGNFQLDNYKKEEIKFSYYVDLRYAGQEHYVKVLLEDFSVDTSLDSIIAHFHKEHEKQFSFALETAVELVNFHLVAEVLVDKPDFPKETPTGKKVADAVFDTREVDFDDLGKQQTPFYHRHLLEPNMYIKGPAIIAEKATTTVVSPVHDVRIDVYGNLILTTKDSL